MKGQAALEYLMTYGWAIVVLLLVIGLIMSSGIFSPTYFVPEQCDIGPNFPCEFSVFTEGGNTNIVLKVRNGFSYDVALNKFDMQLGDRVFELDPPLTFPVEIETGASQIINAKIVGYDEDSGVLKKINVSLAYFSCEEVVNPDCDVPPDPVNIHEIHGKVFANIQQQE